MSELARIGKQPADVHFNPLAEDPFGVMKIDAASYSFDRLLVNFGWPSDSCSGFRATVAIWQVHFL